MADKEKQKQMKQWSHDETITLLEHWASPEVQEALKGTHRNLEVYKKIVSIIQESQEGFPWTATNCRERIKRLKPLYYDAKRLAEKSGEGAVTFKYFKIMDAVLKNSEVTSPSYIIDSQAACESDDDLQSESDVDHGDSLHRPEASKVLFQQEKTSQEQHEDHEKDEKNTEHPSMLLMKKPTNKRMHLVEKTNMEDENQKQPEGICTPRKSTTQKDCDNQKQKENIPKATPRKSTPQRMHTFKVRGQKKKRTDELKEVITDFFNKEKELQEEFEEQENIRVQKELQKQEDIKEMERRRQVERDERQYQFFGQMQNQMQSQIAQMAQMQSQVLATIAKLFPHVPGSSAATSVPSYPEKSFEATPFEATSANPQSVFQDFGDLSVPSQPFQNQPYQVFQSENASTAQASEQQPQAQSFESAHQCQKESQFDGRSENCYQTTQQLIPHDEQLEQASSGTLGNIFTSVQSVLEDTYQ